MARDEANKDQDWTQGSSSLVNVRSTVGIVFQQQWWMRRLSTPSKMPATASTGTIWTTEANELAGTSTHNVKLLWVTKFHLKYVTYTLPCDIWVLQITNKLSLISQCALIDFSKAFDTVDHVILARKLFCLETPVFIIQWIMSFLIDRNQATKLGFHLSSTLPINRSIIKTMFWYRTNSLYNVCSWPQATWYFELPHKIRWWRYSVLELGCLLLQMTGRLSIWPLNKSESWAWYFVKNSTSHCWLSPNYSAIPWLFQVFAVRGQPIFSCLLTDLTLIVPLKQHSNY